MPKAPRNRSEVHKSSPKFSSYTQNNVVNSMEGTEISESLSIPDTHTNVKKRERHHIKRDTLLQRLAAGKIPYSKSHARRLNRKAKEQIAGGWSDMQLAIAAVDQSCSLDEQQSGGALSDQQPRVHVKSSRISEGKSSTLSGSQRRHALELEKNRHPLILSDPNFVSDPFHAIRTHAQNTLVKRQIPTAM